jgi:hypothetical protein
MMESYLCLWRRGQIFMETLHSSQTSAEAETWGNTWSDLIAGLAIVRTAIPSLHPRDVFPRHTANRRGSPSHSKSKNLRIQTKIFIFHKTSITDSPADHLPDDVCDGYFETLFDSNESRSVPRRLNRRRHWLVINAIQFKSLSFWAWNVNESYRRPFDRKLKRGSSLPKAIEFPRSTRWKRVFILKGGGRTHKRRLCYIWGMLTLI